MAQRDRRLLEALANLLGAGSVRDVRSRRPGWQPTSVFRIASITGNLSATVPLCDRFLLASAKRRQYERWRDDLVAYERRHPVRWGKGPSRCSRPGCSRPVRGQGLCRSHYHEVTGY